MDPTALFIELMFGKRDGSFHLAMVPVITRLVVGPPMSAIVKGYIFSLQVRATQLLGDPLPSPLRRSVQHGV